MPDVKIILVTLKGNRLVTLGQGVTEEETHIAAGIYYQNKTSREKQNTTRGQTGLRQGATPGKSILRLGRNTGNYNN